MGRIYNIRTGHEITIPDDLIMRVDDFVSIEIPGGFNWNHHSRTCTECDAFKSAFGTNSREWFFDMTGRKKIIDLGLFGKPDDYFSNLSSFICHPDFFGSRLKFKLIIPSLIELQKELDSDLHEEKYERACQIRDVMQFIDGGGLD